MKKLLLHTVLLSLAVMMHEGNAQASGLGSLGSLFGNGNNTNGSSGAGSCSTDCNSEKQNAGQSSSAFDCGLSNAQQGDIVFINEAIEDYLICQAQQNSQNGQQPMIPPEMACAVVGVRTGDPTNPYVDLACPSYGKKLDASGVGNSEGFGSTMRVYKQCNLPPNTACGCNQTGTMTGGSTCTQSSSGEQVTNYCNNSDARQKIGSFACGPGGSSVDVWDQFMVWHVTQDQALSSGGGNCPGGNTPLYLTPGMCGSGGGGSSGSLDTCQQAILNGCPPPNNYKSDLGVRGFNGGEGNNADRSGVCLPPIGPQGGSNSNGCQPGQLCCQIFNGSDMGSSGGSNR